ncbi:MAG TPA: hypothetical protein DEB71_14145 [Chryseobacterium carnipullorum]|nr:hypothetical protein [Chryseobacterium carnipullorum]
MITCDKQIVWVFILFPKPADILSFFKKSSFVSKTFNSFKINCTTSLGTFLDVLSSAISA